MSCFFFIFFDIILIGDRMEKSSYKKSCLTGIIAILVYMIVPDIAIPVLKMFNIDYYSLSLAFKIFFIIISELLTLSILILIYSKDFSKDFSDFKNNWKKYADKYIKYWIIVLFIMAISNSLITYFTGSQTSANEEAVRNLMQKVPLYMFLSSAFYAPICEELIFRKSLKKIIPIKWLFIMISGLIFGGLHVLTGFSGVKDLLYLIPYCTPGFVLAYAYQDTDNILVSISIHFIHNFILVILQYLIYFL